MQLSAPQPLAATDRLDEFTCWEGSLDDWLKRRARPNQSSGASRKFVVADQGRVFGYYAMAAGAVSHPVAMSNVRRNMPDPALVMVLARLAIDHRAQAPHTKAAGVGDYAPRLAHQAVELQGHRSRLRLKF